MGRDAVWWRVAWRNLWRNRGRTLITASGLAFGYLAAVLIVGLTDGMSAELAENGTRLLVGHVQVHADGYLPERSMYRTLGDAAGVDVQALLRRVDAHPGVVAAAPRVYGGGLVSSGEQTKAALLLGVDPQRELRVSNLVSNVVDGRLPDEGAYEVLLGTELARQLQVEVGDELVLVAPAADGSMGNDLYTLVGIVRTGSPGLDANYALLSFSRLQQLMALTPERIHEVVLTMEDPWAAPTLASALSSELESAFGSVSVEPWTELRPELFEYLTLADAVNFVIVIVIFGMAVFGVANTMLIGTFERRQEFAVVRALGTTPSGVGRTVVYEGIILGTLALIAGALITTPLFVWWHNSPPDLTGLTSGFSLGGSQWRPILRVEYSLDAPIISAVALLLTAIFAAVYPAWKATRVPPADALAGR